MEYPGLISLFLAVAFMTVADCSTFSLPVRTEVPLLQLTTERGPEPTARTILGGEGTNIFARQYDTVCGYVSGDPSENFFFFF
jgi:hypothetical protein